MEIKVLENNKEKISIEVVEEDHTLMNALRKELWNDKDTEVAGYKIEHSLISNPVLIVEHKKDAKKALLDAVERLKKKNKDFKSKISKL
ncbi:DNA-directed RNA polymerase subunit L [Candidatus Woesearchaeota archaeon]|nr:DNA-directed RNA polymerase subunit L [Candidatus Woesearchaeota archaeon]